MQEICCDLLGCRPDVILVPVYWIYADAQHLPYEDLLWESIKEFSCGSFDISLYTKQPPVIQLVDVARWFAGKPLREVAESYGYKKGEQDTKNVTAASFNDPEFIKYATNDADITWCIVRDCRENFLKLTTIDLMHARTLPQLASRDYRRHIEKPLRNDNHRARYIFLRGLHGGRAEAFFRGHKDQNFSANDMRGAYGFSMESFPFLPTTKDYIECFTMDQMLSMVGGVCRVQFEFPKSVFAPCLPVEASRGPFKSLLFPRRGVSFPTRDELRVALDLGCDIRYFEGWGFKTGDNSFHDYIASLNRLKENTTGVQRNCLKLLINSSYGKFIQKVIKDNMRKVAKLCKKMGEALEDWYSVSQATREGMCPVDFDISSLKEVSHGGGFAPEWGALFTGRIRAELAVALNKHPEVVYTATDSAWTPSYCQFDSKRWQVEYEGSGVTVARTRVAEITPFAGQDPKLAHHAIHDFNIALEELELLAKGVERRRVYTVDRPTKLRRALQSGIRFGTWQYGNMTCDLRWDGKRILKDNGETLPIEDINDYFGYKEAV